MSKAIRCKIKLTTFTVTIIQFINNSSGVSGKARTYATYFSTLSFYLILNSIKRFVQQLKSNGEYLRNFYLLLE